VTACLVQARGQAPQPRRSRDCWLPSPRRPGRCLCHPTRRSARPRSSRAPTGPGRGGPVGGSPRLRPSSQPPSPASWRP
jgi:hypothetical protein